MKNITRDRPKRGIHGQNLKTEWKVEKYFFEKKIQFIRVHYTHNFMYVPRNENNNQQQQQKWIIMEKAERMKKLFNFKLIFRLCKRV